MPRRRSLYSKSNEQPETPKKKAKGRAKKARPRLEIATPTASNFSVEDVFQEPTLEQREQIRLRQIRRADLDRERADSYDLPEHRRQYQTQEGVNYSEPHIKPPQYQNRKPNPLPSDPDLHEDDPDLNSNRIAALDLRDQKLLNLDNLLTRAQSLLTQLRHSVTAVAQEAADDQQQNHHASRIQWILTEAIEPWFGEIDNHLQSLIQKVPDQAEQPVQSVQESSPATPTRVTPDQSIQQLTPYQQDFK